MQTHNVYQFHHHTHFHERGQTFEDMPRTNAWSRGRGHSSRPRTKFWHWGQLVLEDLTSLVKTLKRFWCKSIAFVFLVRPIYWTPFVCSFSALMLLLWMLQNDNNKTTGVSVCWTTVTTAVVDSSQSSVTLHSLEPDELYQVCVQSASSVGRSNLTQPLARRVLRDGDLTNCFSTRLECVQAISLFISVATIQHLKMNEWMNESISQSIKQSMLLFQEQAITQR